MRERLSPLDTQRLVVRPHTPGRSAAFRATVAVLLALALWGAFEAGRWRAGYSVLSATAERIARTRENADLDRKLRDTESRLAASEVARRVDRESYAQVEKSLAELQTRLGDQGQELAFYRSVVNPGDGIFGMRIQRLKVLPSLQPRRYRVRLGLVQAARQDSVGSATADFTVEGVRGGHAASLPLSEIGTSARVLNFSFRYFQEVETEIELPADFLPQKLVVDVRPGKGATPVRQTYLWKIDTN